MNAVRGGPNRAVMAVVAKDFFGVNTMKNAKTRARLALAIFAVCGLAFAGLMSLAFAQQLGTITVPTSGASNAQPIFLEGVKDLHNFQFDEAAVAFQKAEQIDPNFALAYWGEAMSHNHPLWAEVDVPAAQRALEKLAPTPEVRAAKAKTDKEKAYLDAVNQLFYGSDDKLARDNAYSQAMAKMYDRWPTDHEVDVLYALSLLGTVRPGDEGFRRQALAAAICLKVFQENPNHPAAAHFIIHAFDDPDHAILALPAARAYAKIAPSAAHALHMPSHIFLRLGMWQDVIKSNIAAYQSSIALIQRLHLPEGREDFHTLSWLQYANLMVGNFDEAKKDVNLAKAADDRNPNSRPVHQGYLGMRARYILETGQWEKIQIEASVAAGSAGAPMYGMDMGRGTDNGVWSFIAGYSAIKLNDLGTADQAIAQLRAIGEKAGANAYAAKPFSIMEKELTAEADLARGQKDDAVQAAKAAAEIDRTLAPPSGPPDPIKPGLELYGDVLLATGHAKEAAAVYEEQLLRTPNRTPSVKALARAKGAQITMATQKP
jgi:tetratricopeptide (TPR) repeat protein